MKGRFFAGFGAALFLITSSALTIGVILTLTSNNNTPQTVASTASKTSTNNNQGANAVGTKLKGFTPLTTKLTHLEISDISKGTGATVNSGATVTANYVGALASTGVIFDSSSAHGGAQTFPLSGVIQGWQLGIPGMKVGGTRELLIPAAMAYGSKSVGNIPANSDLVFIVNVVSTKG